MGLEAQYPKIGCCGQAGAFGYEREHYEVAMRIGEQGLLPAVRKAADDTLIIADGFSCREQIGHGTGGWALNPAELLALVIQGKKSLPAQLAGRAYRDSPARVDRPALAAAAAGALLLYLDLGFPALTARR